MYLDANTLPAGTVLEADLCIVGGGAAGITIAREFVDAGFKIILLEGGGQTFEQETQDLYRGESVGRPIQDLTACRLRYFGGTTNHWGGWCMPLDPIDFEARSAIPFSGWPFGAAELAPWYTRAQQVVEIGPDDYRPESWGVRPDSIPAPFAGPHFPYRVLQVSPPTRFGTVYGSTLKASSAVTVCFHANVLRFDTPANDGAVQTVRAATLAGSRFSVKARLYVLACGGIENPRLLLLSGNAAGIGNARGLVGRYFMAHMVYSGGIAALADPYANFDFCTGRDGKTFTGFGAPHRFVSYVGLSEATMRERGLPGFRFVWLYKFAQESEGPRALEDLVSSKRHERTTWADIRAVMGDLGGASRYAFGKAFLKRGKPLEAIELHCSSEQLPNPQSRVRLGDRLDRFGMRKVEVDWNLTADDKKRALDIHRLLGAELGRTNFARLQLSLRDDDTTWPDDMYGDAHHIGTTRMHGDPAQGVVDADCGVHGCANLFVAGSSVFPTAGAANPTLTIVALALRLADRLKQQLKS